MCGKGGAREGGQEDGKRTGVDPAHVAAQRVELLEGGQAPHLPPPPTLFDGAGRLGQEGAGQEYRGRRQLVQEEGPRTPLHIVHGRNVGIPQPDSIWNAAGLEGIGRG